METTILIGGTAGQGVAQSAETLGKSFTRAGYHVFNYRDYPSLIRGGHNFNVLRVSEKPIYSHKSTYDVIIALDENTTSLHKKNLNKGGIVLSDKGIHSKKIINEIGATPIIENSALLGALAKYLELPPEIILKTMEEKYKASYELNKMAFERGYSAYASKTRKIFEPKSKKPKYFLSGSQAIAKGAIASGMDIYIAYPMTPATPVLHYLAAEQLKYDYQVIQMENEIAVANVGIGASFTGAKSMVGTSGGGFALMSETLSLQGISEIPMVVYLSQRTAPGTGVPTYSTQGDLKFALNAGHGEFPKIVLAPGDANECFELTNQAFYLAGKYRALAIILGDKHVAESTYSHTELPKCRHAPTRFFEIPKKGFKQYLITKSGNSPMGIPGYSAPMRGTSYEHDEYGYTIEDAETTVKMNSKRMRKFETIKKETEKLEPVKAYGKGKNLVIGWGSTKGAILDSMEGLGFRFLQIRCISPFPEKKVMEEIKKAKEVVLVENNVTGLLGEVIAEKTGHIIRKKVLKFDARPLTPDWLEPRLRRLFK